MNEIEKWLTGRNKLYTSVIPGVMDSSELEDMRKLLALVHVYREAIAGTQEFYGPPKMSESVMTMISRNRHIKSILDASNDKAEKIIKGESNETVQEEAVENQDAPILRPPSFPSED